jgi:dTDP-4-amino-4,6-dideoxygalactose transaminase
MSSPDISSVEEEYIVAAVRSGWIAPIGPDVDKFESEVAERVGVSSAVALSSGTAALHLAMLGGGVSPGDVVVTSTMTFAATAFAITYVGAEPYFVDCEPDTGNMDPHLLREALTDLQRAGKKVGAIVPVDLFGKAVNYTEICAIAAEFEIAVIADAAESFGAHYKGRPAGSFGLASALSFNGNKIMTTSGGGMLLTDDAELAARARYLATQARQPVVHYEHTEVGYNYRLSNILAALGRAQLTRLDVMIARRRAIRDRYRSLFADVPGVELLGGVDDGDDNCWLTPIVIDESVTNWSPSALRQALEESAIESRPIWKPMHLQPVFAGCGALVNGTAETLFDTGITLPSGSALTDRQLDRVLERLSEFVN